MRDKSLPPFHTHRCAQMLSWGYRTSLLRGCDEPGEANLAGTGKEDSVCLLPVKRELLIVKLAMGQAASISS